MELSTCFIVKDEAKNIQAAIANARQFSDEIIVVDTGSTDGTADKVRAMGIEPHFMAWRDSFAVARNESLKQATGKWILWMDADDRFASEDAAKLSRFVRNGAKLNEYYLFSLKNSEVCDRYLVEDKEFSQARLFPNGFNIQFENRIHEKFDRFAKAAGLSPVQINVTVDHTGYSNPEAVAGKLERNARLTLIQRGWPENTDFYTFHIDDYICFYYPGMLAIWEWKELKFEFDPLAGINVKGFSAAQIDEHIRKAAIDRIASVEVDRIRSTDTMRNRRKALHAPTTRGLRINHSVPA